MARLLLHCVVAALWVAQGAVGAPIHPINCSNDHPIVGILSQPGEPAPKGHSYIAASYVKFAEAGGARVVPIPFDIPPHALRSLTKRLNGVIIPGGSQNLSPGHPFYDTVAQLLQIAKDAGDAGEHWPLWGTCLGFEALTIAIASNASLLGGFHALNLPSPLLLAGPDAAVTARSRFLQRLPPAVRSLLDAGHALTFENHMSGVDDARIAANARLASFIDVLAYADDRRGRRYVAMFEAKQYPIYGVQFHPEKNPYEWAPQLDIPHSSDAVAVTHAFARFVVDEARCNDRGPRMGMEESLIYSYKPHFTGQTRHRGEEADFEQCYFLPPFSEGVVST